MGNLKSLAYDLEAFKNPNSTTDEFLAHAVAIEFNSYVINLQSQNIFSM
jgi:hypothetical protein